jgi:chitin biosynthesis protein CHS5
VLEWDPIELATADLISLSLYRNDQKAGNIPRPLQMHSTKISGLAVDTEYKFHLVLRTSAGTYTSDEVTVRTHKMTDLSGITITTGIMPAGMRQDLNQAVERIGAKIVDSVRIDTTHFVTTEGRGIAWEKAVESNIPVVRPEWVEACEKNGRILGVTKYYLDALRSGPPHEPQAVPSHPPVPQKDLPEPPQVQVEGQQLSESQQSPEPQPTENGERAPGSGPSPYKEKQAAVEDDTSSSSTDDEPGRRNRDEQKVRFEDGHKVALRPGRATVEDTSSDSDSLDEKRVPSHDGASFQDVAL